MMVMAFTWLVAFIMFGIFYYREKQYKAESMNARLQICNAQLISALNDGRVSCGDLDEYISISDSLRFTVMDTAGIVLYSSYGIPLGSDHSNRLEVIKAKQTGFGYTQMRISSTDSVPCFYSAMSSEKYIVRTSVPYDLTMIQALQNETVFLWTILIISVVLSILAYFASRRFGQNVAKLRDFAALAEKGTLAEDKWLDFSGDELGEISRHIINIYNKERLAIDERNQYYQNLISEEQEKTRIKQELTSSINHELKTPVHAIKGCLETILSNDNINREQIKGFLEKAHEQVKRLSLLLNDVSLITRVTEAPMKIAKTEIDIIPIILNLTSEIDLLPIAQKMRVNLSLPQQMIINGNEILIESLFQNLLTNTIAYSGGRDIFISLIEEKEDSYIITYSDNGVGIREEHYPRLFERFYRVDEGRSRKMGGTGLGLAIVKSAVLFHDGDIIVQTRQGGGLEFVIKLSKI